MVVLTTDHSVVSGRWGQRQQPLWAHLEGREEEGGRGRGSGEGAGCPCPGLFTSVSESCLASGTLNMMWTQAQPAASYGNVLRV